MIIPFPFKILFFFCILFTGTLYGQLGFCNGDLGTPIFTEDFGTGNTNGPPLGTMVTAYTYVNSGPQDGQYTISSFMQQLGSFHAGLDHTPDDTEGKAFIVNASFDADEFYRRTITGLCEGTSYEFSAFLQNVYDVDSGACSGNGIPVNVRFQIWDRLDTTLLASGDTGAINGTSDPVWTQYGLVFETGPGQDEVILKMINNGNGGCGNDLAIDDIVFRACGDITEISSDISGVDNLILCDNQSSISTTLTVNTVAGVFIQWQTSPDGQSWNDIPGANQEDYITPGLTTTTYYRVNTATALGNLGNDLCSFFSDAFLVDFVNGPSAPQSNGDLTYCDNLPIPALTVVQPAGIEIRWFETASSTIILSIGASYTPSIPDTYYAQSFVAGTDCGSTLRTPVTVTALPTPFFDEPMQTSSICENQEVITLTAGLNNVDYLWSTGETSPSIEVTTKGEYTVTVTNNVNCTATQTFQVEGIEIPEIATVFSEGSNIIIEVTNTGNFEYSLTGDFYSNTPIFRFQPGGLYTIYARSTKGCAPVSLEFYHYNLPLFFTPNNDGFHDAFSIPDASFFESSFIKIFDRFGKVLASGDGANFSWDGTYKGKPVPSSDYWYIIETDGRVTTGNVALKR